MTALAGCSGNQNSDSEAVLRPQRRSQLAYHISLFVCSPPELHVGKLPAQEPLGLLLQLLLLRNAAVVVLNITKALSPQIVPSAPHHPEAGTNIRILPKKTAQRILSHQAIAPYCHLS